MNEALRNVVSGEIIDIDTGSADYRKKRRETYDHEGTIKPLWEITSNAHADRIDNEGPTEHDMGYENKGGGSAPTIKSGDLVFGQRREQLTPAEVAHGIKNPKQKQKELDAMFGDRDSGPTATIEVVDPASREERGRQQAGRARRQAQRAGRGGNGEGSGSSDAEKEAAAKAEADAKAAAEKEAAAKAKGGS